MDETTPQVTAAELDAVRLRRAELRESLTFLERCLAGPASGRSVVWGELVHDALNGLTADFTAHVEITEGPAGLHQAILARELRLANAVERLTAEHAHLAAELAALVVASQPPVLDDDVDALRERATLLLGTLSRHRQVGADLVFEAFHTDIGGTE